MKRRLGVLVVAGATVVYALAAWSVAPGFYDGFQQQVPYNFVDPPPQLKAGNRAPLAGSATIRVLNGIVQPASAFTQDAQAQLSWVPGAFEPPSDGASLVVTIKPVPNPPAAPSTLTLVSNVYQFTANARLGSGKDANLALTYSDQVPAPSTIYHADDSGHWTALVSNQGGSVFFISARVTQLGYYAAGYASPASASHNPTIGGGGQWLPIAVALAILLVVVAGIPLAVIRRRSGVTPEPGPPERKDPRRRRRT